MKKNVLVSVTALAFSVLAVPLAAQAANPTDCATNYMCVYGNNDYKWRIAKQVHGQGRFIDPFSASENDEADSFANYSGTYTGCLAQHASGGGDRVTMARGQREPNLAVWNSDEASSMRTMNGC